MATPRLSLRRRPQVKPPPPGVTLATALPRSSALKLTDIVAQTEASAVKQTAAPAIALPPGSESPPPPQPPVDLEQREAQLAQAEEQLALREHSLREREATLAEREREAYENLKLSEAREQHLARCEALLANHAEGLSEAAAWERTRRELENLAAELQHVQGEARGHRERAQALEAELGELRAEHARTTSQRQTQEGAATPAQIAEKARLLAEREAFIEESENTLFHKAQELQELETHLQNLQDQLKLSPAADGRR